MNYTKISRKMLESLTFRTFTKNDFFGFGGVDSPVPMIAELDSEGITVVIDGDYAEMFADQGDGSFESIDSCPSIRELANKPY